MSGGQQGEPQQPVDEAARDTLCFGQFPSRSVPPLFQQPLPPMRACQRTDERIVGPCISAVRRYDYLAATAAFPGHRDADGDRRAVEVPSKRHKRVEMYGKSRVFCGGFLALDARINDTATEGSLAGNHGRQLQLPVFRARLAAIFNGEPGWLDAGSD